MTKTITAALAAALLLIPACGGGGGGSSPVGALDIRRLTTVGADDAWMDDRGGGRLNNRVGVGDEDDDPRTRPTRLLYRFRLDTLPAGEIVDAVLRVHQEEVRGDPYNSLGELRVAHVEFGIDLNPDDFFASIITDLGVISRDPTLGPKELDVTAALRAARAAGKSYVDLRLEWTLRTSDGDGNPDIAYFSFAEDFQQTGEVPELFVRTRLP